MSAAPCVLAIVREPAEFARLAAELSAAGIQVNRAQNLLDALLHQVAFSAPLVICDTDGVDWRAALAVFRCLPTAAIVFLARLADEPLWLEMLNAGAFDLLPKPYDRRELTRIIARVFQQGGPAKTGHVA
jgi:DNA-binding response OmpR family regulator